MNLKNINWMAILFLISIIIMDAAVIIMFIEAITSP